MSVEVLHGDCLQHLLGLSDLDACITDPPYHLTSIVKRFGSATSAPLNNADTKSGRNGPYGRTSAGFMGKVWDGGDIAFRPETWRLVYDALKPGAHLLAFGGSRTFARMFCAIEDAGFEYRDTLMWLYGTGFPKSHDISKAIDRAAGAEREVVGVNSAAIRNKQRNTTWTGDVWGDNGATITAPATPEAQQWSGWGTALKPAFEPIGLFRKPLIGTVAANVLSHGTGAININACRVATDWTTDPTARGWQGGGSGAGSFGGHRDVAGEKVKPNDAGRWPANVLHDGSDEVVNSFPHTKSGLLQTHHQMRESENVAMAGKNYARTPKQDSFGDEGSASRFFYSAKASKSDRCESKHPTVKPLALMRWLVRLITPPGGRVLDCFAGSGTTGEAAMLEGFNAVLIEREDEYVADIHRRIARAMEERTTINTTNQLDMFA